jgi:hypothetical protein
MATQSIFYKLDIQGIVYLVDPMTSIAYTYDVADPTPIGTILWTDITKQPKITLYDNWQEIQRNKQDKKVIVPTIVPTVTPCL